MAVLTVKHAPATRHQLDMGKLCVETCRGRGGDAESCAGTVATAIQESTLQNLAYGDRDSVGLFQQRPSMGWGTNAQIRNPPYAVNKFLDKFLSYRKKGQGWLQASDSTQGSAFSSAPAAWYQEGMAFTRAFAGSASGLSGGALGAGDSATAVQPYEFSRGTADAKEDSWTCSGRLVDEVKWRRFMRGGVLWVASDDWLSTQPTVYRLSEMSPGVVSLSFEFETRRSPTEATLKVSTTRYAILPGDVVELVDEGPASNGVWLVSDVNRTLFSKLADVTLVRAVSKLPEPAPQTSTVNVGGSLQSTTAQGVTGPDGAVKVYQAAAAITAMNLPYVYGGAHGPGQIGVAHPSPTDCSSGVCWVLHQAGLYRSTSAMVSGDFEGWGEAGPGKYFTIMCNGGHVWIRLNGIGKAWRFDTSSYGDSYTASSGGRLRSTPRPTTGFVQRHVAGL